MGAEMFPNGRMFDRVIQAMNSFSFSGFIIGRLCWKHSAVPEDRLKRAHRVPLVVKRTVQMHLCELCGLSPGVNMSTT